MDEAVHAGLALLNWSMASDDRVRTPAAHRRRREQLAEANGHCKQSLGSDPWFPTGAHAESGVVQWLVSPLRPSAYVC